MVRAKKITDNMAITAAHSLADFAEKRGINPEDIISKMDETDVFVEEAADVAMQAINDGVARISISREEAYNKAGNDINYSRKLTHELVARGFIKAPPQEMLQEVLNWAIRQV
jgi:malate dehydrogenase (oxaloacetate-decarboxylating)